MAVIELEGLRKEYRRAKGPGVVAIEGLDLSVPEGASFIGADWQSRTLTTLLTWEPRRARVLVAKALACVVVTAAFALVIQGLIAAAMLPSAWWHGTTAGTGGAWLRGLSGVLLRGTGLVAVAVVVLVSATAIFQRRDVA